MQTFWANLNVTTPWLSSARTDVAFFFAPALIATILTSLFRHDAVVNSPFLLFLILQGFALGPFHQGLTWFQYFDKANLQQYSHSQNLFWAFVAPILVVVFSTLTYWFSPPLLLFVYVVWTIQHIAKQNIGILLLYHNQARNEAIVPRDIEARSIETSAALFSFLFLNGFIAQTGWVAVAVHLLIAFLSIELIWLTVRFAMNLKRQVSVDGKSLNAPALVFWTLSCLAFIPFALAKDYGQGLFVALIMHWFQYVGLNAMLVRRKYSVESNKRLLIGGKPLLLFAGVGILFALVSMPVQAFAINPVNPNNWTLRILVGFVYGLTLSHYFLDAFIWRFREPFNRAAILSYLKPQFNTVPSHRDAAQNIDLYAEVI
ncbi:MAG: hypothetical protein JST89_05800 [Cyanobacteria bacterium SZAS-4]|nr:hypothetical protein [Cyanobacteria bacterium SZAS-4]